MFVTAELASFAVDEFRRNLEGLSAEDALVRVSKADGSSMNAISWSVQHIASHWINVLSLARTGEFDETALPSDDGTPPTYADALAFLHDGTSDLGWLAEAPEEVMQRRQAAFRGESIGQFVLRAVLHTWFHTGEINAVRQALGHPTIDFVGGFGGRLEWVAERRDG
jgi:hypothetical protein